MKKILELIKEKPLLILIIIIVLLLSVIALFYFNIKLKSDYEISKQKVRALNNNFELISPSIAWMETENFLAQQKIYTINYRDLKQQVINQLATSPNETYGFYFEDLNTGSWIGINEKERFMPMSLFKVPLMVSVLEKVQEGEISLDQKTIVKPEDLDSDSGSLASKGAGYEITVKELLTTMIQESDNTAMRILAARFTTNEDYLKTIIIMGLPQPSEQQSISPKEYINMFRSLYFSTYLRRPFSETALTILLDTKFNSQLPAGVPDYIKISHKVGTDSVRGFYHDCGIVYFPNSPYLICIMSQNTTQEKADKMISTLSRIVYEYKVKNSEEE